jgi:glycosyltransferase involved in cell wall biosynthesis
MKIAHLYQESGIRFYEPHAAQLHIYHTIDGLQKVGHVVSLLALQGRQVLFTKDLQVFKEQPVASHFGRLGLSGAVQFKQFESGVRRFQSTLHLPYLALFDSYRIADACIQNLKDFDLIHERFNLLSLGGAIASKRLGIPLVLEVNADLIEQRKFKGIPEKGVRKLFAEWATRFCLGAAAKVVCISTELRDHLQAKWNLGSARMAVLPCAADVEAFAPRSDSTLVRQRLGLTTEPVVMWIGGFYPWHDLDMLLESFSLVLQQRPDARLVLVGDGQTRPTITRQVMENGLRHAVIMTGAVAHGMVPEMLSIADVAVVPSAPLPASQGGTGAPLKLFEYMAAGLPIVATALNQAAEVIEAGQTALFVEADDTNGFAAALLKLLSDPIERDRLGHNARLHAVAQHSWEQYARRLEKIYMDVLG